MISTFKTLEQLTDQHIADPQVGDLFHEMYSYWVKVIARDGDTLTVNCSADGKLTMTVSKFQGRYAYKSIPGYSIMFYDRTAARKDESAA